MEFKGTKGKWFITKIQTANPENDNCGCHKIGIKKDCGMIDVWFSNVHSVNNFYEALANAKLISKAPEMLEMLNLARMEIKTLNKRGFVSSHVLGKIENLIKEATEC